MEDLLSQKMIAVSLDHGGWYCEPAGSHLYLHIVREYSSGQIQIVVNTAPSQYEAYMAVEEGVPIRTIRLIDLLHPGNREDAAGKGNEEEAASSRLL